MKFEIDTRHDQPRFVRSVIALILAALDDGSALPNVVPPNLQPAPAEKLPDPQAVFGNAPPPPAAPVPPVAAIVPPPAPFAPPVGPSVVPPPLHGTFSAPPVAPLPPIAPLAANVALDRDGLPWDARIHAASKTKIAAGTWKLKKGMSEQQALVDGVKAELRATMAIPAGVMPSVAAPLPPPAPLPPIAPLPPVAPPPPPAAVPGTPPDPVDFASFMQWIAGLIQAGRWTHDHTTATLQQIGLPGAVALASRPDLIPQTVAAIKLQLR